MNYLTSYQHAHDAAYERSSDRDDAIDREADAIIADKTRLMEVIELMLLGSEIPIVELLAYAYASECATRPEWTSGFRHSSITKDTDSAIYEAIMKEARCVVDAREEAEGPANWHHRSGRDSGSVRRISPRTDRRGSRVLREQSSDCLLPEARRAWRAGEKAPSEKQGREEVARKEPVTP